MKLAKQLGRYQIQAEIGRSAIASVFRALDPPLDRLVALRIPVDGAEGLFRGLADQAAAAAKWHHPGIVTVYELGEHGGVPFIVLEYLSGKTLRQLIADRSPLTVLEKTLLMSQVADALRFAHQSGAIRLDIRPSKIMLMPDGSARVLDFLPHGWRDFCRSPEDRALYAAPECGASPGDIRSDIFVFGVVCYELLTGLHPFPDEEAARAGVLMPASSLCPDCPESLEQIVQRTLRQDPELRYQTPWDLKLELDGVLIELKRERAASLVAESERLAAQNEFETAQALLNEALALDPGNRNARLLRETARKQAQQHLLEQAKEEIAERRFASAIQMLESALRIDASQGAIRERIAEARALLERSEAADKLIEQALRKFEQDKLPEARKIAVEAVETDPLSPQAAELLQLIETEIAGREARLEQSLADAEELLRAEQFDEAIALLRSLDAEYPNSGKIKRRLAQARSKKADRKRRQRLQAKLAPVESLMAERRFAEAVERLQALLKEFGKEKQLFEWLLQAQKELEREQRRLALENARSQVTAFCQAGDFGAAGAHVLGTLQSYPNEPELMQLLEEVTASQKAWEEGVARGVEEAEWLMNQGRPDLALPLLERDVGTYPGSGRLLDLLAAAKQALPEYERRQFTQHAIARSSDLEARGQTHAALALLGEALTRYPKSEELAAAARQMRARRDQAERQQRIAQRLEAIERKIAEQAWAQALVLAQAARSEFPGDSDLERVLQRAEDGKRRAEREDLLAGIEQSVLEADIDRALAKIDDALQKNGTDPELENRRQELQREKQYRESLREAEVLFGRRQFQEAENAVRQAAALKPCENSARVLLEAIRAERAAEEEAEFYSRGREKAARLIRERQFHQALDLLHNLLSLFPGDPILERDLRAAESARNDSSAAAIAELPVEDPDVEKADLLPESPPAHDPAPSGLCAVPEAADPDAGVGDVHPRATDNPALPEVPVPSAAVAPPPVAPSPQPQFAISSGPSWKRPAFVALPAVFLAAAAVLPIWISSRKAPQAASARGTVTTPAGSQPAPRPGMPERSGNFRDDGRASNIPERPVETNEGVAHSKAAERLPAERQEPAPRLPRKFDISRLRRGASEQSKLTPEEPLSGISVPDPGNLPAAVFEPSLAKPAAPPQDAPMATSKAAVERIRTGGNFQQPAFISGPAPVIPPAARERGIYGVVKMELAINKQGIVTEARLLSGPAILVPAAREAALQRRYRPATLDGEPVEVKLPIQFVFQASR
ncbi:MAG TPA: protein kinase [Bryobacterales bacterium]|jgi:tetratricopeptide (TPR) repeat protein|nr:protein kinase [Bryobacterales bacterium]